MLQYGFENNWLMVLFHWSFLQADVAMTTNHDTTMLMPLELNFQKFQALQFHENFKVVPNFQPCSLILL
jgi:hypothetical protein